MCVYVDSVFKHCKCRHKCNSFQIRQQSWSYLHMIFIVYISLDAFDDLSHQTEHVHRPNIRILSLHVFWRPLCIWIRYLYVYIHSYIYTWCRLYTYINVWKRPWPLPWLLHALAYNNRMLAKGCFTCFSPFLSMYVLKDPILTPSFPRIDETAETKVHTIAQCNTNFVLLCIRFSKTCMIAVPYVTHKSTLYIYI